MKDKPLVWVGRTKKEFLAMPDDVQDVMGYAIGEAQQGRAADTASRMKGHLRDVIEIRADEDKDTYRTMYTVAFEGVIYVLDAFKKKSKKGRATPKADIDRIEARLKAARRDYEAIGASETE